MLKLRDFRCDGCGHVHELLTDSSDDKRYIACDCGGTAERIISMPAVHTLENHMRGTGEGHGGEYLDYDLMDRKTGAPARITSVRQKERLLKERGLFIKGEHPNRKRWAKRPHSVSGTATASR